MPNTTTPTTPAPHLFTTRQALDHELTATGAWKALHTAVHAATPRLTSHAHHTPGSKPVCGLRFTEDTPHNGQARTKGTVLITPDGHLTIRAYTIPGHRWLTALSHLGTLPASLSPGAPATPPADPTTPLWTLRPHRKDRSFSGHLQPADDLQITTLTELPDRNGDINAQLTVAPDGRAADDRAACAAGWLLAISFFHVLITGAPARPQP